MNEEKQNGESKGYKLVDLKVQEAKAVIINNQIDYECAGEMLRGIKELRKKLNDRYMPIKKKTYEAYRMAMDNIKDYENPLSEAERDIKSSMSRYVSKKEAERRTEENRLRKEAEERERVLLKRDFEELGLDKKEAEKEAAKIEVETPEIIIEDETKVSGISYRDNWKFTIVDASKIPREYLIPDEKKIGAIARAMKGNIEIPGINIFSVKVPIIR